MPLHFIVVYRLFQTDRAEGLQVRMSGRQELSGGQAPTKQVPVLPISKVPAGGHGERGGANRLAEGPPWPVAVQAQVATRFTTQSAGVTHHRPGPGARRYQSGFLVAGLLTGDKRPFQNLKKLKFPKLFLFLKRTSAHYLSPISTHAQNRKNTLLPDIVFFFFFYGF